MEFGTTSKSLAGEEQTHQGVDHVVQSGEVAAPKARQADARGASEAGLNGMNAPGARPSCRKTGMLALLDPSQKVKCLVPTTEPSDSHRPRTLFLGPRKERQGFKNKVTDKGGGGLHSGSSLLKASSRPGTTILGLLQSNLEKVSTDSFSFKKMSGTPLFSFRVRHHEGNQGNRINVTKIASVAISFRFQLIESLICSLLCLRRTHPTYNLQISLWPSIASSESFRGTFLSIVFAFFDPAGGGLVQALEGGKSELQNTVV